MPSSSMMRRLLRLRLMGARLVQQTNMLRMPYGCKGEGLHFHGVRQEMNGRVVSARKSSGVSPHACRLWPQDGARC